MIGSFEKGATMKAKRKTLDEDVISSGILLLFIGLNLFILAGYLNYRLCEINWTWYDRLVSSLTPSVLNYLLKPRVTAAVTILTFLPSILMWILHYCDKEAKHGYSDSILFYTETILSYYLWLYLFFEKKNLVCVSIA